MIAEHCRTSILRIRFSQNLWQAVAKEDVVPQHHGRRCTVRETLGQDNGLGQTIWAGFHFISQPDAPLDAVAQQALELILILGYDCWDILGCRGRVPQAPEEV